MINLKRTEKGKNRKYVYSNSSSDEYSKKEIKVESEAVLESENYKNENEN